MHADGPPGASAAVRAPSSSARSASAVAAAVSSSSLASSSFASGTAPVVAVASVSAGSKRKSTAADNALTADAAVAASSPASASALLQSSQEDQPTAAAAPLSAAPSNACLASVLESPAAAPAPKRTRRAAQSAAEPAAQTRSSPMIRLLGTDSGARQSLLESMDLSSIARLQCTGRSWRGWIAEAPFIGARTIIIEVKRDQSNNPSRCPWIRRSVQHLQFASARYGSDDVPIVSFEQLLLLQWSRLRSITAALYRIVIASELLQACFASVAATLQRLNVSLPRGRHSVLFAARLLTAISPLHQLQSLTVDSEQNLASLDLSPLAALPRLQQLTLRFMDPPPCSIVQVDALAQCKSLTHLECGQWLPMLGGPRPSVVLTDVQLQQLEDGLVRLLRLRQDNGAAPLRRLYLGREPMVLPQCWRVLSQFTALEELHAWWSCTLTAADWMLLASFPRLHTLTIRDLKRATIGEASHALLDLGLALPALVHCRAPRLLVLNGEFAVHTEHAALLAQIPSLESFCAYDLRMESLEPLSHAPALTELNFSECDGLNDESINIRAMIPPMPLVSKLRISDPWHSQMTAEEVETFNAALLARLPKLARERFIQN